MNLPIGRFLGKGMHGHCDRVRKQCEEKFGGPEAVAKLFPDSAYQLTHNALFPQELHAHREPRRRHRCAGAPEQAADPRLLSVEVQGRRGGVLPRRRVHRRRGENGVQRSRRSIRSESCGRLIARERVVRSSTSSRGLSRARRAPQSAPQRHRHAESARDGRGARARSAAGARRGSGPALRAAGRHQGRHAGGRLADDVRIADLCRPRAGRRRAGRPAAARRGRDHSRQDQLSGVRRRRQHLQ